MEHIRCYNCMKLFDGSVDMICPHCGYRQTEQSEDKSKEHALKPGTMLNGKYYIGCVLGTGGCAITYTAYNCAQEHKVAIKEFYPSGVAQRDEDGLNICLYDKNDEFEFTAGLRQFETEPHRLATVGTHQGIVDVFETFYANGTAYIVLEFVNGTPLDKVLKNEGKLDCTVLAKMFIPICLSLDRIHKENKIIHRDISPDNIILQENGRAKLIDFGAGMFSGQTQEFILLKRGYAPIEQYATEDCSTPKTDVYAMCATLYTLISGTKPPESTARLNCVTEHRPDPLKSINELGVKIPEQLDNALLKGLSIHPEDRLDDLKELADVLSAYSAPAAETPVEIHEDKKSRRFKIIIPLAAAAAVLIFTLVFFLTRPTTEIEENTEIAVYPELSGLTLDAARSAADKAVFTTEDGKEIGYTILITEEVLSTDKIEKNNTIARQEPASGTSVYSDDIKDKSSLPITVVLYEYDPDIANTGDSIFSMPSLTGLSEYDAMLKLFNKSYSGEPEIKRVYISGKKDKIVIGQNPPYFSDIPEYGEISLAVTSGETDSDSDDNDNNKLVMPDVKGKTESEAKAILTEAGFKPNIYIETRYCYYSDAGDVFYQTPAAGQKTTKNVNIYLSVASSGSHSVTTGTVVEVPDVMEKSEEEAIIILKDAGFYVNTEEYEIPDYDKPVSKVLRQEPAGGTMLRKGDTIDLGVNKCKIP